jgi:hypothetical protein
MDQEPDLLNFYAVPDNGKNKSINRSRSTFFSHDHFYSLNHENSRCNEGLRKDDRMQLPLLPPGSAVIITEGNDHLSAVPNRSKKKHSPTDCFSPGRSARMWLSAWSSQTLRYEHPIDWNPIASFPHSAHFRFSFMVMLPWSPFADTSFRSYGPHPGGLAVFPSCEVKKSVMRSGARYGSFFTD